MATATSPGSAPVDSGPDFDVVIVGAGISGIGAAVELKRSLPDIGFTIIDMRDDIGGTWDLFRYPGVRSDSDMYTLGFDFKPWKESKAIASGGAIKSYLQETIDEFRLRDHIQLGNRLVSASFSTTDNQWTLDLASAGQQRRVTCRFLYLGSGYYSYRGGYDPELPGEHAFAGQLVHPQQWPDDLDHAQKRVAVIGSGATAVTLVPSMAETAAKVTMIQRSPTYLATEPDVDEEADRLRAELGVAEAFTRVRTRNLVNQQERYKLARRDPGTYKRDIFEAIEAFVGRDVRERHFTPSYEPWDQRVCFVPDGDLFKAIGAGKAEVVTGVIETLVPEGVRMTDGTVIEADIVVKATGLQMAVGGEAAFDVDGEAVDFSDTFTYKGLAFSGVPNLFLAFGFLNSSWTLRLELVNRYWVRVLERMADLGATRVTPVLQQGEEEMVSQPFIADVNSGYLQRGLGLFPRQGHTPWVNPQDYEVVRALLEEDPQEDDHLVFEK